MKKWSTTVDICSHIRSNKKSDAVVHPIFEQCLQYTDDKLWIDIFTNCSMDKFPKGFIFQNGYLKHRKGTKFKQITMPETPSEVFVQVKKFISENGSIFSDKDKKIQDEFIEFVSYKKQSTDMTFAELKKNKKLMDEKIKKYVRSTGLDERCMLYLINFGIEYGLITATDVTMSNNEIQNINGIVVNGDEYSLDSIKINKLNHKKKSSSKVVVKTPEERFWGECIKDIFQSV